MWDCVDCIIILSLIKNSNIIISQPMHSEAKECATKGVLGRNHHSWRDPSGTFALIGVHLAYQVFLSLFVEASSLKELYPVKAYWLVDLAWKISSLVGPRVLYTSLAYRPMDPSSEFCIV